MSNLSPGKYKTKICANEGNWRWRRGVSRWISPFWNFELCRNMSSEIFPSSNFPMNVGPGDVYVKWNNYCRHMYVVHLWHWVNLRDAAIQEKEESLKQNENIFSRDLPDAACSSCQNVDKIFDRNKPWHDLEIELWKRYFLEFWIWACAVDKEAGQRIQSICWPHHSCLTLMMTRTTQRRKMPNDKMARIL